MIDATRSAAWLLVATILLAFGATAVAAQEQALDVVTLQDGRTVRGQLLPTTGDTLRIKDNYGVEWALPMGSVKAVVKGVGAAPSSASELTAAAVTEQSATLEAWQRRKGFYIGFGLGYGSLGVSCGECDFDFDREGGFSGWFELGGTLSPNWLLGAETNGWVKDSDSGTFGLLSLSATVYPSRRSGFFLSFGPGFASYSDDGYDASAFGARVGVGFDIPIGRSTSLTPKLQYFRSFGLDETCADFDCFDIATVDLNVVQIGLGVTFH